MTTSSTCLCIVYTDLMTSLAVVTRTTWQLEGLNYMSHWLSHTESLSRSFCSTISSSEPPTLRYTAVSAANKRTCDDNSSGRSFMYTRNIIDPKTDTWGTPEVTGTDSDSSPSRTTVCDRLPRKARIQESALPLIPY